MGRIIYLSQTIWVGWISDGYDRDIELLDKLQLAMDRPSNIGLLNHPCQSFTNAVDSC